MTEEEFYELNTLRKIETRSSSEDARKAELERLESESGGGFFREEETTPEAPSVETPAEPVVESTEVPTEGTTEGISSDVTSADVATPEVTPTEEMPVEVTPPAVDPAAGMMTTDNTVA